MDGSGGRVGVTVFEGMVYGVKGNGVMLNGKMRIVSKFRVISSVTRYETLYPCKSQLPALHTTK